MNRLNTQMINHQLKPRGIKDQRVLNAFKKVPREHFVPLQYRDYAYDDTPLGIGQSQTISQPFIVALMTQELDISPTDNVLEIGTGSGYQTAILAELAEKITTIERISELQENAKKVLHKLHYTNILYHVGDGTKGLISNAPYDKIIVTAATKNIPEALLDQLAIHGKMVIPLGGNWFQTLTLIEKTPTKLKKTSLGGCRFVPLIEDQS